MIKGQIAVEYFLKVARAITSFGKSKSKAAWLREFWKWRLFAYRALKQGKINRRFDALHGTDTASETLLLKAGVPLDEVARGNSIYRPIWASDFTSAMNLIPFDIEGFTLVDIGCGKGKLMMLAANYPFEHIIGIEYSRNLHLISEENLIKYRQTVKPHCSFELVLGDAVTYRLPTEPTICFLFNSLDPPTTSRFLRNVNEQVAMRETPIFIFYVNARTVEEVGKALYLEPDLTVVYKSKRIVVLSNVSGLALWRK